MMQVKEKLFQAFREDHAVFGRALFELRTRLAENDREGARDAAKSLDHDVGAHIAFEEKEFYPALGPFLSAEEIEEMYRAHDKGLELIVEIIGQLTDDKKDDEGQFIERVEALESHVSDCGDLFGAMGGLDDAELARLWDRLQYWREKAPSWQEFKKEQPE